MVPMPMPNARLSLMIRSCFASYWIHSMDSAYGDRKDMWSFVAAEEVYN